MTARPQDVALMPLAGTELSAYIYKYVANPGTDAKLRDLVEDYARANVTAALASAQAREDELRALLGGVECQRDANWQAYTEAEVRAERLEEALRDGLSGLNGLFASGDYPLTDEVAELGLAIIEDMQAALSTNAATQTGETNEAAD